MDVLIDILRAHPPAQVWLPANSALPVVIHGVTAMAILMGSRNKNEWQRHQQFLHQFTLVWPTSAEFEEAYWLLAQYRLTTAISIPDALIAATVLNRGWRLYFETLPSNRRLRGANTLSTVNSIVKSGEQQLYYLVTTFYGHHAIPVFARYHARRGNPVGTRRHPF